MRGFRDMVIDDVDVIVNDGRPDAVAGTVTGGSATALWTRQVLAGGRIIAVVRTMRPDASFDDVHRTAENVASVLGVGAAEVAFCRVPAPLPVGDHAVSTGPDGDVLVVTDAVKPAPIVPARGVALSLASAAASEVPSP